MNRYALILLLLIAPGIASCQSYTLPSNLFDSLVFEATKGRVCDSLQSAQSVEINALLSENLAQYKIITLQKSEIALQAEQISTQLKQLTLERELMRAKNEALKRRLFKAKRLAWMEGAGLVILGALIVL